MPNKLLTESKSQAVMDYISSTNSPYVFCGFEGGYYTNRDVHLILSCPEHGEWNSTSYRSFVSKNTKCPYCSGVGKYTQEIAKQAIISKIIKCGYSINFVGFSKWVDKNPKYNKCVFVCDKGHVWNTCSITDFINKIDSNCGICSGGVDLNPTTEAEIILDILNKNNSSVTFKKFKEWNGCNTKIIFECSQHGEWDTTTIAAFKQQESGCPLCSEYGYNKNKPGYFYVQKLSTDKTAFYKFGITNIDVVTRMKQQKHNSIFDHEIIFQLYFDDGNVPLLIENEIKNNFQCHAVLKEHLPNGYTETINEMDFNDMMETIEIIRKRNGNQN